MKTIAQDMKARALRSSKEGKLIAERAALEAVAFRLIARHHAVRLELGSTFIRVKATLRSGGWKSYFAETFVGLGISLRTAQRWMDLADASAKNDIQAHFKPAMDPQADKIRKATALAQTEVGCRPEDKGAARRAR